MEIEIFEYPSKDFTQRAMNAIRSGKKIAVLIQPGWRSRILRQEIANMPLSESEAWDAKKSGKRFPSFKATFLTGPIVTVHFYALSGGYRMHVEDGNNLKLLYDY